MLAGSWYVLLNYCSDREEIATERQVSAIGKRQIWGCCRTTVSVFPDNQEEVMCRRLLRAGSRAVGFEEFPPGFLSPPKSQPCVRGMLRAVPGYAVHVILLGLYRMDWATEQHGEEKYRSPNTTLQRCRRLHTSRDMADHHKDCSEKNWPRIGGEGRLNIGWGGPRGHQDVGKVYVSKPLLCGRSYAWATFCFLPLSELFTTFSWVKCRITTLLNIIAKQLNEGRNSGRRTVHVCRETCIIAACWAKLLSHKWGTGKEKQLDIAPLCARADPTVTPAWQDQKYLPSALPYCYSEELINTEVSAFPSLFALLLW